jgi:hypothetical protein
MGLGRVIASVTLAVLGIGLLLWGIQYTTIIGGSVSGSSFAAISTRGIGALLFGGFFSIVSASALRDEWKMGMRRDQVIRIE